MTHQILLVEDFNLLSEIIAEYLTLAGHQVHRVRNADDAFAYATSAPVDLGIFDVQLSNQDGISLANEMHRLYKTPIIMMTGSAAKDESRCRAELAEATHVIEKPFTLTELQREVARMLETTSPGAVS